MQGEQKLEFRQASNYISSNSDGSVLTVGSDGDLTTNVSKVIMKKADGYDLQIEKNIESETLISNVALEPLLKIQNTLSAGSDGVIIELNKSDAAVDDVLGLIKATGGDQGFASMGFISETVEDDLSQTGSIVFKTFLAGDEKQIISGYPAPAEFAAQIHAQALLPHLVARVTQGGESFDDAISWAANEAELVSRG